MEMGENANIKTTFRRDSSDAMRMAEKLFEYLKQLKSSLNQGIISFYDCVLQISQLTLNYIPAVYNDCNAGKCIKEMYALATKFQQAIPCSLHPKSETIKLECNHQNCSQCLKQSILDQTDYQNPKSSKAKLPICPECYKTLKIYRPLSTADVIRCINEDTPYYISNQRNLMATSSRCVFCQKIDAIYLHDKKHMCCHYCFVEYLRSKNGENFLKLDEDAPKSMSSDPFQSIYCPFDLCNKKIRPRIIGLMLSKYFGNSLADLKKHFESMGFQIKDIEENFSSSYFKEI
jgi:hypothetical protein